MRAELKIADLDDALASLTLLPDAVAGRALSQALNEAAKVAEARLKMEAQTVFDRPTPFTLNAFRILYAKPGKPEAAIWVKDEKDNASKGRAPEDWFKPQVFGGPRELKASERRLRAIGALPPNRFIAPGPGARLDSYGNVSRGQMQQILSGLGAANLSGSTNVASSSRRSRAKGHAQAFFVMKRGRTPIAIAERRGRSVAIVLAFVAAPQYAGRFDFHRVVRRVAEDDALLESAIDKAVAEALRER